MDLYEKIEDLKIEMSHKNGTDVCVIFVRPNKIKSLLEDNEFLKSLAEKLNKEEL